MKVKDQKSLPQRRKKRREIAEMKKKKGKKKRSAETPLFAEIGLPGAS